MTTITETMHQDHERCDILFAEVENAVSQKNWETADLSFATFMHSMERHFSMEEQVLFPAFEQRTGSGGGPTHVMRMEHQQIRSILDEMKNSLAAQDEEGYLGESETLLMVMRQHNAKEEQILYPMSDQVLAMDVNTVLGEMQAAGEAE